MKTTLTEGDYRGRHVYRFKAVIPRNKEHGIKRQLQKTWRAEIKHPMFDLKTIKRMFDKEAQRWLVKKMSELFPSGVPPQLQQLEITDYEPDGKGHEATALPVLPEI